MKALITGVAGFVGSHLAEFLLSRGAEVHGVVEASGKTTNLHEVLSRLSIMEADIRQPESLRRVVRKIVPDEIYHLAAISSVPRSLEDPFLTYETNVFGTINVLEAAREASGVPRVLCISSAQVYDAGVQPAPLTETAPTRPLTPYAGSKLCAEIAALQYKASWGMPVVVVRPFNCIGPRQSPDFVCSNFGKQMAEISLGIRPAVLHVGDVSRERDFTDVRDAARAFVLALEQGVSGETYNVCSCARHSIREVIDTLADIAGLTVTVEAEASRKRATDPSAIVGDWSKLNQRTGWRPEIPFRQSLKDLFLYWRERVTAPSGQGSR